MTIEYTIGDAQRQQRQAQSTTSIGFDIASSIVANTSIGVDIASRIFASISIGLDIASSIFATTSTGRVIAPSIFAVVVEILWIQFTLANYIVATITASVICFVEYSYITGHLEVEATHTSQ